MRIRRTSAKVAARSAFTLMEVLIVVAILVVLASVSSLYFFRFLQDSKESAAVLKMEQIEKAAQALRLKPQYNGEFPQNLEALVDYLGSEDAIRDPWGNVFQYNAAGSHHNGRKPDIWTVTKEGVTISNWGGS